MTTESRFRAAILVGMAEATLDHARPRRYDPQLSAVPYLPGLDGMRALAVVAVMIYHADNEWLHGGFLGVEVFFVISGYLITLLLMAEREQTGRVDLVGFWARRARRLLPALFTMLFLVLSYTMLARADELGKLRGDLIGSLLYVSNWYQIWVGQGYTAVNDFVPLRHLWSLAVEEQFYLVWPIVMMLMLRRGGTRRLAMTARWLIIAALVVTVAMAVLFHGGRAIDCATTPEAYWNVGGRCVDKTDFLYLSTITRSSGLLLGAAFAMVWRPKAIMRGPLRDRSRMLDGAALVGLVVLGLQMWFVTVTGPSGADPMLFRGGFLITGIATLTLIGAVTHPYTATTRLLALRPLVWVGTRSYGLYLYHWPIYQIIRKVAGNSLTLPQFVVAMIVTGLVTEASYRIIETPIRKRRFMEDWAELRYRAAPPMFAAARIASVAAVLLLAAGVIRLGLAEVEANEVEESLATGADATTSLDDLLGDASGGTDGAAGAEPTTPPATTVPTVPGSTPASSTTSTTTTTTTTTTLPSGPINYLAIGDSVMLGAADVLSSRGYTVNAEQSRQMVDMVPVMQQLGEAGVFDKVVVIHLGTNGPFDRETLDAFLAPLSNVPNVIMINVRADRAWTASNNAILEERDTGGDNIILIDWANLSNKCPGNCFASDGIHLSADGKKYFADLIGDVTGI
jgi:peptidoglycan/LPS O-acetylase OafA/YrhL